MDKEATNEEAKDPRCRLGDPSRFFASALTIHPFHPGTNSTIQSDTEMRLTARSTPTINSGTSLPSFAANIFCRSLIGGSLLYVTGLNCLDPFAMDIQHREKTTSIGAFRYSTFRFIALVSAFGSRSKDRRRLPYFNTPLANLDCLLAPLT